ncbi:GFA family protein [Sedimenticola hydrogenitrophicus]|uniref:GFA family protein n=1 Tax=Sedimenticola hydrogenitrophicus TaxID=2967975 RepID=UPI0023B07CF7|nr:GFA family protein [Sedimenticola hydrogenitrophicus]
MTSQDEPQVTTKTLKGSCLCGCVEYEVDGPLRDVVSCYCDQCRKSSGNFVSATAASESRLNILRGDGLAWYGNKLAKRGFCRECGSSLFWLPRPGDGLIRIMAGTLQRDTGLRVAAHIFVNQRSDFQELVGDAPRLINGNHPVGMSDAGPSEDWVANYGCS